MRIALAASVFLLVTAPLVAQTPESAPAAAAPPARAATSDSASTTSGQPLHIENSDVGFSYTLASNWDTVTPPSAHTVSVPFPDAMGAKKGDACVEVVSTAKQDAPASVVVVVALPFACYGQALKTSDLANFGNGAAEGLKQTFDVTEPILGNYMLGSHPVWIERAKGTPKGHAGDPYTFETACTVLAKGAVCWMTMAADWHSLRAFERAPVTLDGDTFTELVPPHSFVPEPK